jgi:hypothetical protein
MNPPKFQLPSYEFYVQDLLPEWEFMNEINALSDFCVLH